MKVLELFSGTHSVGKVCKELDYEVISLDLKDADININILDWDYKKDFKPNEFDIIWASPPCTFFSKCRKTNIGKKLKIHNGQPFTIELFYDDLKKYGIPIFKKTLEIIDYFKPTYYFIENPHNKDILNFMNLPYYIIDYCRYADWGYRKKTIIFTNKIGFEPKLCNKKCFKFANNKHPNPIGIRYFNTLKQRYRVPPKLIKELIIVDA